MGRFQRGSGGNNRSFGSDRGGGSFRGRGGSGGRGRGGIFQIKSMFTLTSFLISGFGGDRGSGDRSSFGRGRSPGGRGMLFLSIGVFG